MSLLRPSQFWLRSLPTVHSSLRSVPCRFCRVQARVQARFVNQHIRSRSSQSKATPQIDSQENRRASNARPNYFEVSGEGYEVNLNPKSSSIDLGGGSHQESGEYQEYSTRLPPRVRYLRPALYAMGLSAGIFSILAYKEAVDQSKPPQPRRYQPTQLGQLPGPVQLAYQSWNGLDPISKVSTGIIGACAAVHLSSFVAPTWWNSLWHMPIRNVNYSLFTSTFVHAGLFHLGFNMWACYNFLLPTGYSRLFEGNPYHVLAYFLSTGVLTAYAQHLTTAFSKSTLIPITHPSMRHPVMMPVTALIRCGGASGALLSFFAVFCMQYPNAEVGIVFIPYAFAASTLLPCVMAFDLYGMVKGFKAINFGHAAHLSGMLIGVAYSQLDGKNKIWKPLVNFFKRRIVSRGHR